MHEVRPQFHSAVKTFAALVFVAFFATLFLFSAPSLLADSTLADDGFEDGEEGGNGLWNEEWELSGDARIQRGGGPHGGDWHLRLRRDTGRTEREVDLSAQSSVHLQFWAKAESFESGETAAAEVSPDGDEWTVLHVWNDGDDDGDYQFFDLTIPDGLMSDEFFIAFDAQMSGTSDRLYIDDVALVSVEAPAPAGTPTPTPAATSTPEGTPVPIADITLDGQFDDWDGMPHLVDPPDDADDEEGDIYQMFWANNVDGDFVYWRISRYDDEGQIFDGDNGQKKPVKYTVWLDTNNDGDVEDSGDMRLEARYDPKPIDSKVTVRVRPATGGGRWITLFKNEDWGDSEAEGGINVEFGAAWDDLGLTFGQPIRMFAESDEDDRIPDSGDVQWSPASILGPTVLIALFMVAVILLWWFKGRRLWKRG